MLTGSFCRRISVAEASAAECWATAEQEARQRGCTRVALTTLSVEAPGFYRKQGYDIVVTIDCDPPGLTRYCMMKKLRGARCAGLLTKGGR